MFGGKSLVLFIVAMLLSACSSLASQPSAAGDAEGTTAVRESVSDRSFKIYHVMSYHSPWEWTDMQLEGFQGALADVPAEYEIFQMDAKNFSSSDWLESKGKEARERIDAWQPDLIYASDDEAQDYVTRYYANTHIPIVFSAVNRDPADYGMAGADNVTGVLEIEHFRENLALLRELDPSVRNIAAVFDDSRLWEPVIERMKAQITDFPGLKLSHVDIIHTFEEYKRKMLQYQTEADAVALIGIFNFKDKDGQNAHYQEVLKWTAENSQLPDFSFWKDRASHGTLSTVTVSGYAQGWQAGELAKAILTESRKPSELPVKSSAKSEAIISLARANKLGLKIKSSLLLDSQIYTKFEWEKQHDDKN